MKNKKTPFGLAVFISGIILTIVMAIGYFKPEWYSPNTETSYGGVSFIVGFAIGVLLVVGNLPSIHKDKFPKKPSVTSNSKPNKE
jgi:hypothetical protein